MADFVEWGLEVAGRDNWSEFAALLWCIWKERCSFIFENGGPLPDCESVILKAKAICSTHKGASMRHDMDKTVIGRELQRWKPPSENETSISVDASMDDNGNCYTGLMIRNSAGAILWAETSETYRVSSILHGEIIAIRNGICFAGEHRYSNFTLWSDCQVAVILLYGDDDELHPLNPLLQECKRMLSLCAHGSIVFTRREHNMPAHLLARFGAIHHTGMVWGPNPPPYVFDSAIADLTL